MTTTAIPGRRTRTRAAAPATTAVGYLRVSTADQATSGLGLDAQRDAITTAAAAQGLTITAWHEDAGVSGTVAPGDRPGMSAALATLTTAGAGVLIAAKLDRLSRSVKDAAELMDRADREGWRVVTADGTVGADNSPMSRAMVGMSSVFAQMERDLIAMRTREALASLKAQGVQLGHPTTLSDEVITRILRELSAGQSLRAICRGLETDGIPTASGRANWHPQQVRTAADSQRGQIIAAALFGDQDTDAEARADAPGWIDQLDRTDYDQGA